MSSVTWKSNVYCRNDCTELCQQELRKTEDDYEPKYPRNCGLGGKILVVIFKNHTSGLSERRIQRCWRRIFSIRRQSWWNVRKNLGQLAIWWVLLTYVACLVIWDTRRKVATKIWVVHIDFEINKSVFVLFYTMRLTHQNSIK